MFGFVPCIIISNIIDIGAVDCSWDDVKTIKSGKKVDISSDVSEKHTIVYTYTCTESDKTGRTNYESNINDCHTRHVWNDEDEVFDRKLEKWVLTRLLLINWNL